MRHPRQLAQDFYTGFLSDHEELVTSSSAVLGGTGTLIGIASVAGSLCGWLYSIYLTAPLLPSLVLGGLAGVFVGYVVATRSARKPDGPGAVHLTLIQTSERLIVTRRYPAFRQRPLRIYQLDSITATWTPLPVGGYQRLVIREASGLTHDFIVTDHLSDKTGPVKPGAKSG